MLTPEEIEAIQRKAEQDKQHNHDKLRAAGITPTQEILHEMMHESLARNIPDFIEKMANRDSPTQSPLTRPGESDEDRIMRLLREGTARECLLEANYWLNYYLGEEDAELELVSTALALNEHALSLLSQPERAPTNAEELHRGEQS